MAPRPYRVEVTGPAGRDLAALSKRPPAGNILQRIDAAILSFTDDPRPAGSKKLAGEESVWRLRIGDYRLLFEVDDDNRIVTIARILHRREAYQDP